MQGDKKLGSVCSGGRYDNLTEYYCDRKMPGVGISIGLSRLFFQLIDNNIISAEKESSFDVLVISMNDDYKMCAKVASILRNENINVQVNLENGEDEIKNNKVTLKDMQIGNQCTITIEEAIEIIHKI